MPVAEIRAYASSRSEGTTLSFRGSPVPCLPLDEAHFAPADLVLASAGSAVSRLWSPRFAAAGAVVIDNSSAFRRDPDVPLVVPEINPETLRPGPGIVANPNCSTIQMVVALAPLHRRWGLAGVRVATYQSVSGAGGRAMRELEEGSRVFLEDGEETPRAFSHPIAFNVLPRIGPADETGESTEERKMRDETRRILDLPDLPVSAFCARVPVFRGHSEAVWAWFRETPDVEEARAALGEAGVVVQDDPDASGFPLPREAAGDDRVFVGRVRRDPAEPRGLVLWVVADNLLKGAAANAWQIAEVLWQRGWLAGEKQA